MHAQVSGVLGFLLILFVALVVFTVFGGDGLRDWLAKWQELLAGFVAVCAAAIAWLSVVYQIKRAEAVSQREQNEARKYVVSRLAEMLQRCDRLWRAVDDELAIIAVGRDANGFEVFDARQALPIASEIRELEELIRELPLYRREPLRSVLKCVPEKGSKIVTPGGDSSYEFLQGIRGHLTLLADVAREADPDLTAIFHHRIRVSAH